MQRAVKKPFPARSRIGRRYNWLPDLPDQRDLLFAREVKSRKDLPKSVDLRSACSPVVNQGKIGSCTGNALAGALEFLELAELAAQKGGAQVFDPQSFENISRLFIYYNERWIQGTVEQDSGAMLRNGIKALNHWGSCTETLWDYNEANLFKKPTRSAYAEGKKHLVAEYLRLETLSDMKQCLADDYPFVFGFSVYESFEGDLVARTGRVPMPKTRERVLGGHAVLAVGYDDQAKVFIVKNSWGSSWAGKMQGYFTLPYDYISDAHLAQDFWTLRA